MHPDDEKTRSGAEERSPAIDAFLAFDRQMYITISAKEALSRALCESGASPTELEDLINKVSSHWDSTERVVMSMDTHARTDEQDLVDQARSLLEEYGLVIGNVLSRALDRTVNAALQARVQHQITRMQSRVSVMQLEVG